MSPGPDFWKWLYGDDETKRAQDAVALDYIAKLQEEVALLKEQRRKSLMADYSRYQQEANAAKPMTNPNPYPNIAGSVFPPGAKSVNIQTGPSPKEEWVEFVEERLIEATKEKIHATGHAFVIDNIVCAVYHPREHDEFEPKSGFYLVQASIPPVHDTYVRPEAPISFMVHGEDTARQMAENIGRAWAAEASQTYAMWIEARNGTP